MILLTYCKILYYNDIIIIYLYMYHCLAETVKAMSMKYGQ